MTIDERVPEAARAAQSAGGRSDRAGKLKRDTHRWARWLHVYSSMFALVLVLFFGLTGLTLNHPSWTFGDDLDVTNEAGTLPFPATFPDGTTDYLSLSEFARETYDVNGAVDSFQTSGGRASISYRNAGYAADLLVDVDANTYEITIEQQGWVGVLNDLHKGRDTGSSWKWAIDVSALFLVVIALTGLVMQFFLRKRRTSAFVMAGAGLVVTVFLIWFTLR